MPGTADRMLSERATGCPHRNVQDCDGGIDACYLVLAHQESVDARARAPGMRTCAIRRWQRCLYDRRRHQNRRRVAGGGTGALECAPNDAARWIDGASGPSWQAARESSRTSGGRMMVGKPVRDVG